MRKIFYLLILLCLTVCILTGCSNNQYDEKISKEKVLEEIKYVDSKIISIANGLNNISFSNYRTSNSKIDEQNSSSGKEENSESDEKNNDSSEEKNSEENSKQNSNSTTKGQSYSEVEAKNFFTNKSEEINWGSLAQTVEELYMSWPTIMLDLQKINVQNSDLLAFSNLINRISVEINNENKNEALNIISSMYSYIPVYVNSFSANNLENKIYSVKSDIINSYTNVSIDNWEEAVKNIDSAINSMEVIIKDVSYTEKYNIDKSYILLNETKTSITEQNKDIYYMKYKYLMEEISIM